MTMLYMLYPCYLHYPCYGGPNFYLPDNDNSAGLKVNIL